MQDLLLVRYGEIFLKGLNRPYFIRALVRKIRYAVRGMGAEVWVHDGRIFIRGFSDLDECISRVTKVFGVHSVSPAVEMPKEDFDAICNQAIEMVKDLKGTFKVNARRSDKRYPLNSPAINEEVGYRILNANPNLKVDVHNPDYLVNIEIREKARASQHIKDIFEITADRAVPAWLSSDQEYFKGIVEELPTRDQIDVPVDEMLIVELYSK